MEGTQEKEFETMPITTIDSPPSVKRLGLGGGTLG